MAAAKHSVGDPGDAGHAGDARDAGDAGDVGDAGAAGDAGDAGDVGDAGAAGDTGVAGDAGDAGSGCICWGSLLGGFSRQPPTPVCPSCSCPPSLSDILQRPGCSGHGSPTHKPRFILDGGTGGVWDLHLCLEPGLVANLLK